MTARGGDLRVLVVDDEPLARRGLRELLGERDTAVEILEASGGAEAIRLIREERPDVVFLDVQMPRIDGFGVIEEVGAGAMPPVVFVTAYDEHAVRAFEVHAVDYLLKPVDPARLADAFDRAARAARGVEQSEVASLRDMLVALLATAHGPPSTGPLPEARRLAIRSGARVSFVAVHEITWIEALGNYVNVHLRGGTVRHRATMEEMDAVLGPDFVRIRRAALVRAGAVRWCEPMGRGSWLVTLDDGTRLTSSRYFRGRMEQLLGP